MQCSNAISFTTIPQASCEKLLAGHLSVKLRLKTTNPCLKYICPNFYHHMYFVSCRKSCIPQNNDAYYLADQPDQSACSRQADDPAFYTMCLFAVYTTIILAAQTTGHKINGLQNKF
jgi:hypothetical protein